MPRITKTDKIAAIGKEMAEKEKIVEADLKKNMMNIQMNQIQ